MYPKHFFKKSFLATGIALAIGACGSSGSSTTDINTTGNSSFSGTVADGYLRDALVCLDLNANKVCDEGEPSAISTEGGAFTLDEVTQAQLDTYSLVVEIVAGVTEDEDEPGVAIDKPYTMTAPAGYDFISPLTTMVKQELEQNESNEDFSVEDAEASIQAKLGTNLDLREDYVEAKGADSDFSEADKEEFEKLHKVAQVTARIMKENIDDVAQVVDETEVSFDQILDMVVGQVLEALTVINDEVEDVIDSEIEFDPDALAVNEDITDEAGVDVETVESEIAARQAEKTATSANLIELVTSVGINWFGADERDGELELFYGSFQHDPTTSASNDTKYFYDSSTSAFVRETDSDEYGDYLLTANGWLQVPEHEVITINDDGSITVANAEVPSYAERLEADEFDIAGLNIASTLAQSMEADLWAEVIDPEAEFSDGSVGFKLTFTTLNDQYRMWDWDCEESQVVGGMCNSVWATTGDGEWETDGQASSLSALISSAASNTTDPSMIKGPQVAWSREGSIHAEMIAGGQVNFYRVQHQADGQAIAEVIAEGRWDEQLVGASTLVVMELPTNVVHFGDLDYRDRFIFLTELDGFVRRGEYVPAGEVEHGEVVFNIEAKEEIIAAFLGERFNTLETHLEQDFAEESQASESTDGTVGDNSGQGPVGGIDDSVGNEEESGAVNGPAPLLTTLQACDFGDVEANLGSTSVPAFATRSEFDAAVAQCGTALPLNPDYIANKRFIIADQPNESIQFMANNVAVLTELFADGTAEVEDMTWALSNGELTVYMTDANGLEERETIVMLASDAGELSLKGFREELEWYEGADYDGSRGEIWSGILVEDVDTDAL